MTVALPRLLFTKADPATLLDEMMADSPSVLWPMNDGSGAPQDVSGNGYHLGLVSGSNSYYTDVEYGTVLRLSSGVWSSTFRCPQSAYTIEFWVIGGGDDSSPMSDGTGAAGVIYHRGAGNAHRFYHNTTAILLSTPTAGWFHIVATWDGTTVRVYRNGVEIATATTSTAPGLPAGGVSYVSKYATGGYMWSGSGRYFAWYDHALSPARVAAHYAVGSA